MARSPVHGGGRVTLCSPPGQAAVAGTAGPRDSQVVAVPMVRRPGEAAGPADSGGPGGQRKAGAVREIDPERPQLSGKPRPLRGLVSGRFEQADC